MKIFLLFALVVAIIAGSFTFWTQVLDGQLPSWGGLYDSSSEEKKLAEQIAKDTIRWRKDRVLPDFRNDETLCPYALRRAKEEAAHPGDRYALQKMVGENTMTLQTSYSRAAEVVGTAHSADDFLQMWSENELDRDTLQDHKLSHHCVRCTGNTCAQLFIEQK